jgi:hypothetical protein
VTHDAHSNFNHNKHISTTFIMLDISYNILIQKYKNTFFLHIDAHKTQKQISFTVLSSLFSLFDLLYFHYHIYL